MVMKITVPNALKSAFPHKDVVNVFRISSDGNANLVTNCFRRALQVGQKVDTHEASASDLSIVLLGQR